MLELDIAMCGAEERDPLADEYGNACDNEALNEPGLKKPLNGNPAIHVNMPDAASGKLRHDFGRIPRQSLHNSPGGRGGERVSTERENGLGAIRPRVKGQDRLEGLASYDKRIHRGYELIVAVGFAAAGREPIDGAIDSSDETVEASGNKDGRFHYRSPFIRQGFHFLMFCSVRFLPTRGFGVGDVASLCDHS